ncbi:MAG: hypothetical protein ACRC14_13645 [Paracoccaceae bacterium]
MIAEAGTSNPVAALLREVNETILGRALRFEGSGGSSLTLEASGRRVLRVTDARGLPGAETCLAVDVLEDEQKDDLIKLMQALAAPRHELRVSISARGVAGEGVSVGLPVALLADLMLIELNDATGADSAEEPATADVAPLDIDSLPVGRSLARFVQSLGPALMAWVIRGGEADGSTDGAEEMVTHLQGFLDDEVDALQRQLDLVSGRPGSAACLVLGTEMIEGHGVLCARSGDAILLALFEGSPSHGLINAWAEARG